MIALRKDFVREHKSGDLQGFVAGENIAQADALFDQWYGPEARAQVGSKTLYDANREGYNLLRYGVKVKPEQGKQTVTVRLIDWKNPCNNDFAIAEEVTVTRREHQAAGHRALCQRHRPGRAGAEALDRVGDRGHPPEPRQPEKGIHPAVLRHHPAHHGRQRNRGAALRPDRHAGEVLAPLEGSRGPAGGGRQSAAPRIGTALPQRPAAGDRPRLHSLRRGDEEGLPPQPVFRRPRGAETRQSPRGRHPSSSSTSAIARSPASSTRQ